MKIVLRSSSYILASFLLMSCGGSKDDEKSITSHHIDKKISVSHVPYVESLGIATTVSAQVDLGSEPKDIYVLLSNYANIDGTIKVSKSVDSVANFAQSKKLANNMNKIIPTIIHAPANVEKFRANIISYLHDSSELNEVSKKIINIDKNEKNILGTEKIFYLDTNGKRSTLATMRKVTYASTVYGNKRLNIWVSNESYGEECPKIKCVTQNMVDALANIFLRDGVDNDVYDWVTNVYGEEWGKHSNKNLISNKNEITILLTDIDNDNRKSSGVVGFFFPKDSFKREKFSGSNEKIMLYADSVVFANSGEDSWSINSYWAKEMVSTLAHEFQHLIHYYQKSVRLDADLTDTWINEMLSESTEDLVASKIGHSGPRGVDYRIGSAGNTYNIKGRYPLFNIRNRLSLTRWTGELANYSVVNSFGAFLLRNYGGARILHDIIRSKHADQKSIVDAVRKTPQGSGKTFNDLQKEWGIAVLLSDHNHLGENLPRYNIGGYMSTSFNHSSYNLGSINFFNYNPQPTILSSRGIVEGQGNYYYKVGTNLQGLIDIDLTLNGKTEATLIVK